MQINEHIFTRLIIVLDDQALYRKIICDRTKHLFQDPDYQKVNHDQSIVFHLFRADSLFNLCNEVKIWLSVITIIAN